MLMQVIVVHVSFLAQISYDLYGPSAAIDSAQTALRRISVCSWTIWSESRGEDMDFLK